MADTGPGESILFVFLGTGAGSSRVMSDAPHISHERRDGWFVKVHLGHWNDPPVSTAELLGAGPGDPWAEGASADLGLDDWGRNGNDVLILAAVGGAAEGRLLTFAMAAFRTWVSVGLMPHARQGGRGVWAVAVAGSKVGGTGLEKLHITHTHVAAVTGCDWGCRTRGLDRWDPLGAASMRLGGLGTSVIFADDLRNPA